MIEAITPFVVLLYEIIECLIIVSPLRSTYGGYYGLVVVTPRASASADTSSFSR